MTSRPPPARTNPGHYEIQLHYSVRFAGTLAVLPNLEVLESLVAWAPQGVYMRMLEEMMRTKQADQGKYNHHDH